MQESTDLITPLGKHFAFFTKKYIGLFSKLLEDLPIERYFYPLYIIGKKSGAINQKELTEILNTDKVTVNRIIEYLHENEMIDKKIDPVDRRCFNLHINDKAIKYIDRIEAAILKTDETILSLVQNKEAFQQLLSSLYDGLQNQDIVDVSVSYERLKRNENE